MNKNEKGRGITESRSKNQVYGKAFFTEDIERYEAKRYTFFIPACAFFASRFNWDSWLESRMA